MKLHDLLRCIPCFVESSTRATGFAFAPRERERLRCGSTATMCSALSVVLVSSSAQSATRPPFGLIATRSGCFIMTNKPGVFAVMPASAAAATNFGLPSNVSMLPAGFVKHTKPGDCCSSCQAASNDKASHLPMAGKVKTIYNCPNEALRLRSQALISATCIGAVVPFVFDFGVLIVGKCPFAGLESRAWQGAGTIPAHTRSGRP